MKIPENNSVDELIEHSLQQQLEMLDMLKSLTQHIEIHSLPHIEKFNTCFHELQQASQHTDKQLLEQSGIAGIPEYLQEQFEQRDLLQHEILRLLKETLPKAKSVKSLMANEIQTVKKGRNALNGYKAQEGKQGRVVNKSL